MGWFADVCVFKSMQNIASRLNICIAFLSHGFAPVYNCRLFYGIACAMCVCATFQSPTASNTN